MGAPKIPSGASRSRPGGSRSLQKPPRRLSKRSPKCDQKLPKFLPGVFGGSREVQGVSGRSKRRPEGAKNDPRGIPKALVGRSSELPSNRLWKPGAGTNGNPTSEVGGCVQPGNRLCFVPARVRAKLRVRVSRCAAGCLASWDQHFLLLFLLLLCPVPAPGPYHPVQVKHVD